MKVLINFNKNCNKLFSSENCGDCGDYCADCCQVYYGD